MNEDARKLFNGCASRMLLDFTFFGAILVQLRRVEDLTQPTFWTNGVELGYNPEFLLHLYKTGGVKLVCSAIAHEVMHVALMHMTRRGKRDPNLWNAAGDYFINPQLLRAKLPLGDGWLYETRFDSMSADAIYAVLVKENPPQSQNGQGSGQGTPQPGQGQPGHGQPNAKGQCACGGMREPKNKNGQPLTPAERRLKEAGVRRMIQTAVAMAKAAGKMPGGLERVIGEIVNPKIPWEDKLRLFAEVNARNDYSWARPNKKFIMQGVYIPTIESKQLGEMAVVLDTSGSVSDKDLVQPAAEISDILLTCKPSKLHVLYCDTKVAHTEEFTVDDLPLKLKPHGGGGTDFRPPFKWLEEQGIEPILLIYFTDLYCSKYPPMPDYPVMWAHIGMNKKEVPFGEIIELDRVQQ